MARDPDIWGSDAREMKPERWIDEHGQLRKFSTWQAHMFNGGARCPPSLPSPCPLTRLQAPVYASVKRALLHTALAAGSYHSRPGWPPSKRWRPSSSSPGTLI
jgi:hypothetical protein